MMSLTKFICMSPLTLPQSTLKDKDMFLMKCESSIMHFFFVFIENDSASYCISILTAPLTTLLHLFIFCVEAFGEWQEGEHNCLN